MNEWWAKLKPETREWMLAHPRQPISWHILEELQAAGARLHQDDPNRSVFCFTDAEWDEIEAQPVR